MDLASNKTDYQECYLTDNLSTFWEPQSPRTLWAFTGLYVDYFSDMLLTPSVDYDQYLCLMYLLLTSVWLSWLLKTSWRWPCQGTAVNPWTLTVHRLPRLGVGWFSP